MLGNFDNAKQIKEEAQVIRNEIPGPPVPRTATSVTDTFVATTAGGVGAFPIQVYAAGALSPVDERGLAPPPTPKPAASGIFSRTWARIQAAFDKWEGPEPRASMAQLERERKRREHAVKIA